MKFSLNEEEHRIQYTEYHQQYMVEFEEQIQKFIEAEQLTEKEFFLRCRSAQQTDGKAAHYLGVFLASIEYESFYNLMIKMKKQQVRVKFVFQVCFRRHQLQRKMTSMFSVLLAQSVVELKILK